MNGMMKRIAAVPPRLNARLAGFFWLLVFVAGSLALAIDAGAASRTANMVGPLCYAVATLLIYDLLKPVSRSVSLVAAWFSLVGCAVSLFGLARLIHVRDLVFFGVQCLLVGYLIFRSNFLPRMLGVGMMLAGLGWLTFAWPSLAAYLSPYNMVPGMIGEGLLILWLLWVGVDDQRWKEQERAA